MGDWGNTNDTWASNPVPSNDTWGATPQQSDFNQPVVRCTACSQEGHEEAKCPNQHVESNHYTTENDKCFNCGESGHRVADCPIPRDTSCRYCKQEGHMLRDCPEKPPMKCENCGQDGHMRRDCQNARVVNRDHIADVSPDEALARIKTAASERDVEDVKEGVQEYVKAVKGDVNYHQLQSMFIGEGINLWLIATERQLVNIFTNMDLQGNTGKKYSISYRFSERPERPREIDGWPQNRDDILTRLEDAGEVVNSGLKKCHRCGELGHSAKECTEERTESSRPTIICSNCNNEGHRIRDCPEPRIDKFACKNCGKSGHRAADCEEPPNLENMECRKCGEKGHMGKDCPQGGGRACRNCGAEGHVAKDCDQPRNMDNVTCRNCEKTGHFSRDCPEPKDWSKVQCSNCQQFGHTKVRCKASPADADELGTSGQNGDGGNSDRPTDAAAPTEDFSADTSVW